MGVVKGEILFMAWHVSDISDFKLNYFHISPLPFIAQVGLNFLMHPFQAYAPYSCNAAL